MLGPAATVSPLSFSSAGNSSMPGCKRSVLQVDLLQASREQMQQHVEMANTSSAQAQSRNKQLLGELERATEKMSALEEQTLLSWDHSCLATVPAAGLVQQQGAFLESMRPLTAWYQAELAMPSAGCCSPSPGLQEISSSWEALWKK